MVDTVPDNVISRIQKLMALTAERGASEAEAQLAAEHVQRLLAEHNLSMSAVERRGGSTGADGKRTREGVDRRQVYKWQRSLMAHVAELNFCKALTKWKRAGWSKADIFDGYDLIGRESNVVSARLMFDYLLEAIERLARIEVNNDPSQYFTRYAHSFKEGMADRLMERLADKRKRMMKEQEAKAREDAMRAKHPGAASSNALVVLLRDVVQDEKDLNYDFLEGLAPGTTARERAQALAEQDEYKRREAERKARRVPELMQAHGVDRDVAEWLFAGYDMPMALYLADKGPNPRGEAKAKPETDTQRRKREERERNEQNRQRARWDREASRLDQTAYARGQERGADVGLDRQAKEDKRGRLS